MGFLAIALVAIPFHAPSVGGGLATPDAVLDVVDHRKLQASFLDGTLFAHGYGGYGCVVEANFREEVDVGVAAVCLVLPGHVVVFEVE